MPSGTTVPMEDVFTGDAEVSIGGQEHVRLASSNCGAVGGSLGAAAAVGDHVTPGRC